MSARGSTDYEADIAWTTHGVAHIKADDWASLAFGQGWACARDHLPTLVDQIVKVRSERTRYHGLGRDDANLASDFGYLHLDITGQAEALRDAQTPMIRDLVSGYVAGTNAYLAEARAEGSLPEWCADAPWLQSIEEIDLYRYAVDITLLASGRNLVGLVGRAEAPGPDGPLPPSPMSAFGAPADGAGSNGWAFGGDVTASGHGIVVANPHFPWHGEARFWECHLTIPGRLDVYGATLVGTPGVTLGANRDVAWTHTVSKGHRFTLSKLELVAGRPTAYRHGDEEREMTSSTHTVTLDDGSETTRTLWRTHHGPMVNLPLLGWGNEIGFTYRDANEGNHTLFDHWLTMDQATGIDDVRHAFATHQGIPWVNTLAADRSGRALYIDGSSTPNLAPSAQERFVERVKTDPIAQLLYANRVALFDGSDPDDDWVEVEGARTPGLVPYERQPQLERRDVVINANDSHWLTNPDEPLTGYSPMHGIEGVPQSMRTRQNLRVAPALAAEGAVTVDRALEVLFENTSLSSDLLRDAVVERLRSAGRDAVASILADWDGRFDLDSRGAVLWRELIGGFQPVEVLDAGPVWATAFDPTDPVNTPIGLAPAPAGGADPWVVAADAALDVLGRAGVAPDAPLGEVQWGHRGGKRIPIHGGGDADGICNIMTPINVLVPTTVEERSENPAPILDRVARTGLHEGGYPCSYGASFLLAVELTDDGPVGKRLLAYGQSADPASPHRSDATESFSRKELHPILFTEADIAADPNLERRTITA